MVRHTGLVSSEGTVNVAPIWGTGQYDNQNTQLPMPSLSLRTHQLRHLAFSSIVVELP